MPPTLVLDGEEELQVCQLEPPQPLTGLLVPDDVVDGGLRQPGQDDEHATGATPAASRRPGAPAEPRAAGVGDGGRASRRRPWISRIGVVTSRRTNRSPRTTSSTRSSVLARSHMVRSGEVTRRPRHHDGGDMSRYRCVLIPFTWQSCPVGTLMCTTDCGRDAPPQITAAVWWLTTADGGAIRSAACARHDGGARGRAVDVDAPEHADEPVGSQVAIGQTTRIRLGAGEGPVENESSGLHAPVRSSDQRVKIAAALTFLVHRSSRPEGTPRATTSARDDLSADISDLDRRTSSRAELSSGLSSAVGDRRRRQNSLTGLTMSA